MNNALELYKLASKYLSQRDIEKARPILSNLITQYPDSIYTEQAESDLSDIDNGIYLNSKGSFYIAHISTIKNIMLMLITPFIGVFMYHIYYMIPPFGVITIIFSSIFYIIYMPTFIAYFLLFKHNKKTTIIKMIITSSLASLTASMLSSVISVYRRSNYLEFSNSINEVVIGFIFLLKLSLAPAIIGSLFLLFFIRERHYY